jgi:hypothetical protein
MRTSYLTNKLSQPCILHLIPSCCSSLFNSFTRYGKWHKSISVCRLLFYLTSTYRLASLFLIDNMDKCRQKSLLEEIMTNGISITQVSNPGIEHRSLVVGYSCFDLQTPWVLFSGHINAFLTQVSHSFPHSPRADVATVP